MKNVTRTRRRRLYYAVKKVFRNGNDITDKIYSVSFERNVQDGQFYFVTVHYKDGTHETEEFRKSLKVVEGKDLLTKRLRIKLA